MYMYCTCTQYIFLNLKTLKFTKKKLIKIKKGKLTISEYMYMYFILTHPILHVAKRAIASVGNVVGIFGRGTLETPFSPTTIFFSLSVFFFPINMFQKSLFFSVKNSLTATTCKTSTTEFA